MAGGLALPHPNGLNKNLVVAGSLAEDDGFARLAGHTTQRPCGRGRADEGLRVNGEFLHARLVAKDAALGALGAGVDGEDGELAAVLFEDMEAKDVDAGALTSARDAANADADGLAGEGEALLYHLLSNGLMFGQQALHEGDGLREDGDVAAQDALDVLGSRHLAALGTAEIGVDALGLLDAGIDSKAFVFC